MAKGKTPTEKPRRQTSGLRRLLGNRAVQVILLATAAAGIVLWQWRNISAWGTNTANDIWAVLGFGLLLIVIGLAVILAIILRKQLAGFLCHFRHIHHWLSGLVLFFAIWGLLGWLELGGRIGLNIAGDTGVTGFLRVTGLFLLAVVLMAPRASFRVVSRTASRVARLFRSAPVRRLPRPAPRTPQPRLNLPDISAAPASAKPPPERKPQPVTPTPPQELKQVAQEVWKKFGESPALTMRNGWKLPPVDILDKSAEVEFAESDNDVRARKIEEALASYGVDAKVVQINTGPTVTQFGVEPGWDRKIKEFKEKDKDGNVKVRQEEVSKTRVKVDRITSLGNDLALALAAPTIRMEAPVPGKSMVGIEVPNIASTAVSLRGVIETPAYQKMVVKTPLALALGKGAGGEGVVADLAKMPHLLIAGATGSGKTVCLNAIIVCLLLDNTPEEVKLILVDPKRVELTQYNTVPHLATPVIVDSNKAVATLRWLSAEMDRRYQVMAKAGARNIEGYNKDGKDNKKMPYLVLVIDELADLMMTGFEEVEHILCRLAQLARATGIHLVVATQRPSVDVVTGLIKANFPTRISFAVTSQVDSRTILDSVGAEKLLGKGDMLYMPTDAAKPKRLQGCYVSDPEIERLVYFWGNQKKAEEALKVPELADIAREAENEAPADPLLEKARALLREHKRISTSFLQRKLHIGYPRAAELMDLLEQKDGGDEDEDLPA